MQQPHHIVTFVCALAVATGCKTSTLVVDAGTPSGVLERRHVAPRVDTARDAGLRLSVLFVGNSYTQRNDLPAMLRRISETSGSEPEISVDQITPDGVSLKDHRTNPQVLSRINERRWSHVVIQGQSQEPRSDLQSPFQENAHWLAAAAVDAGALPVWYVTWARSYSREPEHDQNTLTSAYAYAASRWPRSILSCVGEAFRRARREHPTLVLHQPDGSHPTVHGTYLAAATFYVALTGKPVPLASATPREISADDALVLRDLARVGSGCANFGAVALVPAADAGSVVRDEHEASFQFLPHRTSMQLKPSAGAKF